MPSVLSTGQPARRVLVLCRPYLGDLVLSGPVFRNLRAWLPDAHIAAGIYREYAESLSFFPEIDEVVPIPRRVPGPRTALLGRWMALVRRLREQRFDLVYDLLHTDRSSLVTLASGAPVRVGYVKDRFRFRHRVYTHLSDWSADLPHAHSAELFLKPLAEIGMPVSTRSIDVVVTPSEAGEARERLARALGCGDGPCVLVHPGAGTPNRLWPAERFAAVCDDLQEGLDARVLLLGCPGERGLLDAIRDAMRVPAPTLDGPLTIRGFAALLQQADLVLGLDSGPVHLAAAVGTPAVALFGAALPSQWRPLGAAHRVVRPEQPCAPCVRPGQCRPPNPYHMFCVQRLRAEEVIAVVRERLEELDRADAARGQHR